MDVQQLLDACMKAQDISTDGELAKAIGVSKQAMSSWRHGARLPDPVACATIAGLTGMPLAQVLGIVGEARAISREEKAVWRKLASAAVVIALLSGGSLAPVREAAANVAVDTMHYAKLKIHSCQARRAAIRPTEASLSRPSAPATTPSLHQPAANQSAA